MVCGTSSDAGKSTVVAGLCRLLAREGLRVAPFKAQNMALNSFVTAGGHEIGRAQGAQALAAGVEPEVAMNPILLKPTGERTSQVIVLGRPVGHLDAAEYHRRKPELLATVLGALADLRRRFDVVVLEGAGSPAEINLLEHDIVNLRIAAEADLPAVVVGDIDRGGVFAALYGTVALLPPDYRRLVKGFVINKFRGDPALLGDGLADLERRSGVPTLGVLPWMSDIGLDAEDSLALSAGRPAAGAPAVADTLDVAVVASPSLSNFTDLDALALEPGVVVRYVDTPGRMGDPDLVVLPGTKATVADLAWARRRGLDLAVQSARRRGALVLGICGGYQWLGTRIVDPVESGAGEVEGLGWLDVETHFEESKLTRQRRGRAFASAVTGYEIHHGRTRHLAGPTAWIDLEPLVGPDGSLLAAERDAAAQSAASADGSVLATSLHGLFESDEFRAELLRRVGERRGKRFVPAGVRWSEARLAQWDRVADALAASIGVDTVRRLVGLDVAGWTGGGVGGGSGAVSARARGSVG
jgi:adenosylcobyric acid synthase